MRLIDASNAEEYLRGSGRLTSAESVTIRELPGGVSNVVLLVSDTAGAPRFVLKQAREQLRVAQPWFCSPERIWREVAVMQVCLRALEHAEAAEKCPGELSIGVPRVLFTDREQYLFAMTAVGEHSVWKSQLMQGVFSLETAAACGRLLGTIHAQTWGRLDVAQELGDQKFFDALRLDPYYRHVARTQSELAPALQNLEQSLADHPRCLVHGDFSPKNLLVHDSGVTLVDFEVGHFGDPAFDLGFFLTHLLLKATRRPEHWPSLMELADEFWRRYQQAMIAICGSREYETLVARGIANLAGCLLARVDGKSPVDYLQPPAQESVRRFARELLLQLPTQWSEVISRFGQSYE
jgi:5-methylthioribose kinase